ncbi:MAG: sugar porter family MFS transporter [Saprospiraceae bacterium]|nr:sugar porter family MFS transporter [Saprospiraceae bacterium]
MKNNNLLYWSITVALAGFLFGFDTAVISGADQPIQKLWGHSDLFHGVFIMSMALWGTVIGAMFGGIPCNRWGRKNTLIVIGILYALSAIGSALAFDPYSFSFFRFIGGLGVGASSVAAPIYVSEIAPADKRGRLVALYQFNIVLGILIAYVSNYLIGGIGENAWRWMLGVETIPAIAYLVMVMGVPNSPRWLVLWGNREDEARDLLTRLGTPQVDEAIAAIKNSVVFQKGRGFFSGRYNFPILLAFLLAAFNQLSGINFVIYYAPRIFESAGLGASTALLSTAGIGLTNLIFTMLGIYLIDRSGRKKLMLIGSIGYIISLALVSRAFFAEDFGGLSVPIFLFIFIASHAIGQGAVIWVFISEIFPNQIRANGQAFGSFTHWIFAAVITLIMPYVLGKFDGGPIFAFFGAMMVLQLLFVIFLMPETKGIPLEELEKKLIGDDKRESLGDVPEIVGNIES